MVFDGGTARMEDGMNLYEEHAKEFLGGKDHPPDLLLRDAKRLAETNLLYLAREVAEKLVIESRTDDPEVIQKWALWHSKDEGLPVQTRHQRALEIIKPLLEDQPTQETLGIAGGICKRMWESDRKIQYLQDSLEYYRRGYEKGIENDNGYTAINMAFLIDLKLFLQKINQKSEESRTIRTCVRDYLLGQEKQGKAKDDWWWHSTIAEAHFGLGEYEEATERIKRVFRRHPPSWRTDSTARQIAWLAHIQEEPEHGFNSGSWRSWSEGFDVDAEAGWLSVTGKFGLALSGGGFRASFFHIGVLAALAELDLLRHVEVLSGVSGGAILSAHYYLAVRELLQEKDEEATRDDYIELVRRLSKEFMDGVKKNLRTRIPLCPWLNLRMIIGKGYSRTTRLADLIERCLYGRYRSTENDRRLYLDDLLIKPGGRYCHPKYENWRRKNKVPVLILNATTLNTGHNWQFTCAYLGEPPSMVHKAADPTEVLQRRYFKELKGLRIRLGEAVAASASVPGLFEPLSVHGLYKGEVVRLVDGGVHDNQGTTGLLEQNCSILLVSDASGQIRKEKDPSSGFPAVPMRVNDILMNRVRTSQFCELVEREQAGRLQLVAFLHLRQEIAHEMEYLKLGKKFTKLTSYGIRQDIQDDLSRMRTDLDTFCDIEAHALMASGYSMARAELPNILEKFRFRLTDRKEEWPFLEVLEDLKESTDTGRVNKVLEASHRRAFRILRLLWPLKLLSYAGIAGLLLLLICYIRSRGFSGAWEDYGAIMGWAGIWIPVGLLGIILVSLILMLFGIRKPVSRISLAFLLVPLGWLAYFHILVFDRLFIWYGKRPQRAVTNGDGKAAKDP